MKILFSELVDFIWGFTGLATIPGIQGDMGWLDCRSRWNLEVIRQYNRFISMEQSRLNRTVFVYDRLAIIGTRR